MSTKAGFQRFQGAMADFASEYIKPSWAAKKKGEKLERLTDSTFSVVFYGFTEISNTLDALDLIEMLMGLSAPRSKKIKKDQYLKFLVGAYLQEVYILEQRLTSYTKKLGRTYRVLGGFARLTKEIRNAFSGVTQTRGSHVHAQRFTDEKLEMLAGLSLVSTYKPDFIDDLHFEYKHVRREWSKRIKENNLATKIYMDSYCDELLEHISKDGEVFLPQTQRAPRHARRKGQL